MAAETNTGSGNPIAQAMAQAKSATENFTRMFSDMKLPGVVDMEVLVSALRRNMETLTAVNHIASEGAQAVTKRHMEIMQQTMAEVSETLRSLATLTDTPQAKAAMQAELLKKAYERAVSNSREIGDMIQRSGTEAMELLNHRCTEALGEVKSLVEKGGTGKP